MFIYLSAVVFNTNGFVAIVDYRSLVLNAQLSQFNRSNSRASSVQYRTHEHIYIFTLLLIPVSLFCFVSPPYVPFKFGYNNQWTFSIISNVFKSISRQVRCETKCSTQTWYDLSATIIICKRNVNLIGNGLADVAFSLF